MKRLLFTILFLATLFILTLPESQKHQVTLEDGIIYGIDIPEGFRLESIEFTGPKSFEYKIIRPKKPGNPHEYQINNDTVCVCFIEK